MSVTPTTTTTKVIRSPSAATAETAMPTRSHTPTAPSRFRAVVAGSPAFDAARRELPDATLIHLTSEQVQRLAALMEQATARWQQYGTAAMEMERRMTAYQASHSARRWRLGGAVEHLCRAALLQGWERTLAARRALVGFPDEAPPDLRPALDAALRAAGHWPVAPIREDVTVFMTRLALQTSPRPVARPPLIPFTK